MKRLSGFLLAALVTGGAVKLSYAQNGDNSGRFSTPAYSGTDYAQAGSGAGGAGAAAPAQSAPRTAITPGSSSTAIQPQPGSGTALSPGAPAITPGTPAINPGVNTAITPPELTTPQRVRPRMASCLKAPEQSASKVTRPSGSKEPLG